MPQILDLTLESVKDLNASVRHFVFKLPQGLKLPFVFIPGQFIRLFIPSAEGKPISRSYSLANNKWDPLGYLECAASYVKGGLASEYLFNLPLGSTVKASGPFGKLVLKEGDNPKQYIFISTNTGVTPFRAMLPLLETKMAAGARVILLQGVREPDDLLYREDFLAFSKKHPTNFTFMACYSRQPGSEAWEHQGYVQQVVEQVALNPIDDIVYLCGNPNMIDEAYEQLKDKGFSIENIRREKYISP
jgi:ferredoxin-NADP reductase